MNPIKGYRLYVDLGASQVRRRLKGYGFGVRRVESVDRGRAVIIHTATGDHLRQLESLFPGLLHREAAARDVAESCLDPQVQACAADVRDRDSAAGESGEASSR